MSGKLLDRLVATGVFAYALVVYLLTVAPTASFWDCGEFIAIAHGLEVSHPPGAPFYMLVGRLFSMVLAPLIGLFHQPGHIALAVNLVSVVSSAATVLLTHLVIVQLIRIWKGDAGRLGDRLATLAGGAIGALAFAVTDSFWFNAVEAEVYAPSMFFTAIVVWLILKWRTETIAEEAALRAQGEHPFGLRADRLLVLIAYLFGLAIGVHLLNVLTLFFLALIIYFLKIEQPTWSRFQRWAGILGAGAGAAVLFVMIYPGIIQVLPDWAGRFGRAVADAFISPGLSGAASLVFFLAIVAFFVWAVWWTHRTRRPLGNLLALSFAMVLLGYSTYALIFIRSAADPPIDENDPETVEAIVSYLKREQYGETPLLPRRWSPDPSHQRVYSQYDSDSDYFWGYQVNFMYVRYFLWNFVGKASDTQNAPFITGVVPDETAAFAYRSPSERASRNAYFGLPLLLGLIGLAFHFLRDWRRAFAVLVLFFMTGIGIILYLNQTPLQPRERDYSYVASFFAFSLWIGIGATGLMELTLAALRRKDADADESDTPPAPDAPAPLPAIAATPTGVRAAAALAAFLFAAVPGWMLLEGYDDHDRSGQYVAVDFAYNMLNSTAPHAILFTNGDNDTFPLWYLQEVEGVRRDVRVVNLSLLNTPWYIRQLRDQQAHTSAPLPITLTDAEVDALGFTEFQPFDEVLPVNRAALTPETLQTFGDTTGLPTSLRWRVEGRPLTQDRQWLQVSDQLVLHIVRENARRNWERPIYFATTVARDSELGLNAFFQSEGLARRVVPLVTDAPEGRVVNGLIQERLDAFRFTGLADTTIYYDENIRQLSDNYRVVFGYAAEQLAQQGRRAEARALLDRIAQEVTFETIPPDFFSLYTLALAEGALDNRDAVVALMREAEAIALHELRTSTTSADQQRATQYATFVQRLYLDNEAYDELAAFSNRLADLYGNPELRTTPEELRQRVNAARAQTPDTPTPDTLAQP